LRGGRCGHARDRRSPRRSAPNPAALTALGDALELAEEAHVFDLAGALADPGRGELVSALLCHELAACHRLMMRFGTMADDYLSHTSPTIDADRRQVGRDAIGFAIAARLMARYCQGALALPKLRAAVDGGTKKIVVDWGCDDDEDGGHGPGSGPEPAAGGPASSPPGSRAAAPAAAPSPGARPAQERQPLGRLPGGAALRGEDAGRLRLPPAGHDKRPLPPARRQEHRCPHRRGPPPRPHRPPRPRPAHRRGHQRARRRRGRQSSLGLDDRPRPQALRWTWGGSLGSVAAAGRCRDKAQTLCAGYFPAVTPAKAGGYIPEA